MTRLLASPRRISGSSGVVFLILTLIAVIMSAFAMMSRNNAAGLPDQNAKGHAAVLMKQGADLRLGIERMLADGRPAASITFDDTVGSGMFDSSNGNPYSLLPVPPGGAAVSGNLRFSFNKQVKLPGIGDPALADYVFVVGDITVVTCQQLNKALYSDAVQLTPGISTGTLAEWTGGAAIDDSAVVTRYNGRPEGCIVTSDGKYVYYKTAVEY